MTKRVVQWIKKTGKNDWSDSPIHVRSDLCQSKVNERTDSICTSKKSKWRKTY
jgi:hypothetical protein